MKDWRAEYLARGRMPADVYWQFYRDYLASDEWKAKRGVVYRRNIRDGKARCERCNYQPMQCVHHKTYARVYAENPDTDLIGLCYYCHEYGHNRSRIDPCVTRVEPVESPVDLMVTPINLEDF